MVKVCPLQTTIKIYRMSSLQEPQKLQLCHNVKSNFEVPYLQLPPMLGPQVWALGQGLRLGPEAWVLCLGLRPRSQAWVLGFGSLSVCLLVKISSKLWASHPNPIPNSNLNLTWVAYLKQVKIFMSDTFYSGNISIFYKFIHVLFKTN